MGTSIDLGASAGQTRLTRLGRCCCGCWRRRRGQAAARRAGYITQNSPTLPGPSAEQLPAGSVDSKPYLQGIRFLSSQLSKRPSDRDPAAALWPVPAGPSEAYYRRRQRSDFNSECSLVVKSDQRRSRRSWVRFPGVQLL